MRGIVSHTAVKSDTCPSVGILAADGKIVDVIANNTHIISCSCNDRVGRSTNGVEVDEINVTSLHNHIGDLCAPTSVRDPRDPSSAASAAAQCDSAVGTGTDVNGVSR